jgi:hypothetical protein
VAHPRAGTDLTGTDLTGTDLNRRPLLRRGVLASIGISVVALVTSTIVASCATDEEVLVEFHEAEVGEALDVSGLVFETPDERAEAIASFRTICVDTSANSVNEFSVYDMLVNPDDYPAGFVETAEIGCPVKFATAREKLANGDCFGGVVSVCDD